MCLILRVFKFILLWAVTLRDVTVLVSDGFQEEGFTYFVFVLVGSSLKVFKAVFQNDFNIFVTFLFKFFLELNLQISKWNLKFFIRIVTNDGIQILDS